MAQQSFQKAKVESSSPITPAINANKSWGKRFGHKSGFFLKMPHGNDAGVFVDKRLISGDYDTVMQVFGKVSVAGYVISCEKKEWIIETEPTELDGCGLVVYTKKRKALMAGTIKVKKNGEWTFAANTLYPGIRNRKKVTAALQGGARGGTGQRTDVQGGGTITVEF